MLCIHEGKKENHPDLTIMYAVCQSTLIRLYLKFSSPFQIKFMDCQPSSKEEVEIVSVDVNESKDLIFSGNHRYLDVRTEEEFKKGHVGVENAFNIPYMFNTPQGRVKNPKFLEQVLSAFNKDDNLVVGCQSGVRSVYATTDLLKAEFKHVYNMGGGYLAWVANGFTVKIPQTEEETLEEAETEL